MDAGRDVSEIDETIDARKYIDTVYKVMRAHHSQRGDGETHIKDAGDNVAINHFRVLS